MAVVPLGRDASVLVSEVRSLRHVAEQARLDNACQQLDAGEQLKHILSPHIQYNIPLCQFEKKSYRTRILHLRFREGGIDDEVAVVRDNRASLHLRHAERWVCRTKYLETSQHLRIREWYDLDGNALFPLQRANER